MVICLLVPPPDVCQADGKGWGAFASATVEAGTLVGSYEGTVLSQQEVERRYYGGAGTTATPDYLFELPSSANGKLYIDARDGSHWSRFINHCEDGNLTPSLDAAGSISFFAARRIRTGEEYTFGARPRLEPRWQPAHPSRSLMATYRVLYADYGLDYWVSRDSLPRDDSRIFELQMRRIAARLRRASPQLAMLSSTLLLPLLVPILATRGHADAR